MVGGPIAVTLEPSRLGFASSLEIGNHVCYVAVTLRFGVLGPVQVLPNILVQYHICVANFSLERQLRIYKAFTPLVTPTQILQLEQ